MNKHVAATVAAEPAVEIAAGMTDGVTHGVTRAAYRDAMARLGAAVNVITTDGPAGRAGFTASAVCSVTDEPPTLLVCLNRSSSVIAAFETNAALCVNVCGPQHQSLATLFGGRTPSEERFAAAAWSTLASGAPVLDDAAAAFDCVMTGSVEIGTHRVLFCRVLGLSGAEGSDGLVYFNRRFHALAA